MYASCSEIGCGKKSKYLMDIEKNGKIQTHSKCREHGESEDSVKCRKDIHDIVLPLSSSGSGTQFIANCSFCSDSRADEIIRFEDGLGVTSTEARCLDCVDKLVDSPQEIISRHTIGEVNLRAEDCK